MKKKKNSSTSQRKLKGNDSPHSMKQKAGRFFLNAAAFLNAVVAIAMIVSAYGSFFEPADCRPLAVFAFAFPICFFIELLAVVAWLIFKKWKMAIIFFLPFLLTAKASYTFFPLNILPDFSTEEEKKNSFSLMTYNVFYFCDAMKNGMKYSRAVSEIIKGNNDIVTLQEVTGFEPVNWVDMNKSQSDSLKRIYPYRSSDGRMGILSKYPILETHIISTPADDYNAARYRIKIKDEVVTIFNVHLKSIGLTNDDKEFYEKTTSKQIIKEGTSQVRSTLSTIKNRLYRKLADAMVARARQAKIIRKYIDKEKGNVILCGDFNDISTSYAYRKVKGDMTDAYANCAFGPTITYHKNRFYFKIDYVMYSGNLKAVKEKRPGYKWSDHFPLVTEFVLKQ